jgi:hypothetical protein
VQVLDDFIELNVGENDTKNTWIHPVFEFDLPGYGDSLNLWYVAVTRAKITLSLPPKFW